MKYLIQLVIFIMVICGVMFEMTLLASGKISTERFISFNISIMVLLLVMIVSIHVYKNLKD